MDGIGQGLAGLVFVEVRWPAILRLDCQARRAAGVQAERPSEVLVSAWERVRTLLAGRAA